MPKQLLRSKRCKHRHLSGRRCHQVRPFDKEYCGLHKAECAECKSMASAFGVKYLEG